MRRTTQRLLFLLVILAVSAGSLEADESKKAASPKTKAAPSAAKQKTQAPAARVHFSGNFQGELEPCG